MQNTQDSPSTTRVGLKYGFFTALACLFVGLLFALLFRSGGEGSLNLFLFAIGIAYGMLEFRRASNGVMSYLQAFNLGMIVSVISGLCLGVLSSVSIAMLKVEDLKKIKGLYVQQLEQVGYNDAQIETTMATINFMFTPTGAFTLTLLGWAFIGLFMTAILGLFMRRN